MAEGRDLRNKVVFVDEHAYAVGGLNSKAEKFNFQKRSWGLIQDYPIADNLDSWACAMTFIPKEHPVMSIGAAKTSSAAGLLPSINSIAQSVAGLNEDEEEFKDLLEQERIIDQEIQSDLEKYRMEQELLDPSIDDILNGSRRLS